MPSRSVNCTTPASANPQPHANSTSAAPRCAASWTRELRHRNMAKPRRNPDRENRISEEIIVDAYGPEEQAMGWYYYLEDKLQFPFQAQCIASVPTSPLRKGESVEI